MGNFFHHQRPILYSMKHNTRVGARVSEQIIFKTMKNTFRLPPSPHPLQFCLNFVFRIVSESKSQNEHETTLDRAMFSLTSLE